MAGYSHAGKTFVSAGFACGRMLPRDRLDHVQHFEREDLVVCMAERSQSPMPPHRAVFFLSDELIKLLRNVFYAQHIHHESWRKELRLFFEQLVNCSWQTLEKVNERSARV